MQLNFGQLNFGEGSKNMTLTGPDIVGLPATPFLASSQDTSRDSVGAAAVAAAVWPCMVLIPINIIIIIIIIVNIRIITKVITTTALYVCQAV